jgi:hypothetical protein
MAAISKRTGVPIFFSTGVISASKRSQKKARRAQGFLPAYIISYLADKRSAFKIFVRRASIRPCLSVTPLCRTLLQFLGEFLSRMDDESFGRCPEIGKWVAGNKS